MGYPHSPKGNVDFFDFSHLTEFSLGTEISSENDENSKGDVDSFEFSHLTECSFGTEISFEK